MNFLTKLRRRMIANKFKQQHLKIIQFIPHDVFFEILRGHKQQGWEMFPQQLSTDSWGDKGKCKLRKGQSTLELEWTKTQQGSLVGLGRILDSIAKDYELESRDKPEYLR